MATEFATLRRRQLARIHMMKAQLGMTDEQYRAVLWTVAQVDSAAQLDDYGRKQVIAHLASRLPSGARVVGRQPSSTANRPLLRKIAAQLKSADRSWVYAESLAKRIAHKERLEFCTDAELGKIVAALSYDAQRRARG